MPLDTPLTFNALRVLTYLTTQPDGAPLSTIPDDVCPEHLRTAVQTELTENGWLIRSKRMAGPTPMSLVPKHRGAATQLYDTYRAALAQRRLLEQTAQSPDTGSTLDAVGIEDFTGTLTDTDVAYATEALSDANLLKGIDLGGELARPELTSEGRRVLRSPYAPEQYEETSSTAQPPQATTLSSNVYNNQFHGPVGAFQQGSHNTATVEQNNTDLSDFMNVIAEIRSVVTSSSEDNNTKQLVLEHLDAVEDASQQGKSPGYLRMATQALLGAGAGELASNLPDLIRRAIEFLPG